MRISTLTLYSKFNYFMEDLNEEMGKSLERVASGRRLLKPSDDPSSYSSAIRVEMEMMRLDEYKRGMDASESWMKVTEAALKSMEDVLERAESIAITGASDSTTPEQRKVLAKEVEELLTTSYQIANTKHMDSYIFAGFKTDTKPFIYGDTSYRGDDGSININIGPGTAVQINIPGSVFVDGVNIFQTLQELEEALESSDGETIRQLVDSVRLASENVSFAHARLGGFMKRIELVKSMVESRYLNYASTLSELTDADIAQEISGLNSYELSYKATLLSMSKLSQLSLFDYLG